MEFVKVLYHHLFGIDYHDIAQRTLRDLVLFLILLMVTHVLVEIRLLAVGSLADVAIERFLRRPVDLNVHGETRRLGEGFIAIRTLVRFLSRMNPCVG